MTENTAAVGNVVENGVASETNQQQNNNNNNNNGTNLNGYKKPPKEIIDIVDIPPQPLLSFSPDRKKVLQVSKPSPLPPIFELARPELKLAGLRVDADQFSRSRMSHYTEMLIVSFSENTMLPHTGHGELKVKGYPSNLLINNIQWGPDSKHVAFTLRSAGGPNDPPRKPMEVWVADTSSGEATRLLDMPLNSVFEDYKWIDDTTILATVIPKDAVKPPSKPEFPTGPKIQDNTDGQTTAHRTYQDLLKDEHDEELFEYYSTSQPVLVDVISKEWKTIGEPRIYVGLEPSPDEKFLIVAWFQRPFSYSVPCGRFPKVVQVWNRNGDVIKEIANLPLAESIPPVFDSCRQGPRNISWRSDKDATVCWTEAQDGGDPTIDCDPRDIVYTLNIHNADEEPQVFAHTKFRFGGIGWCDDDLAIISEGWWKTRKSVSWLIKPGNLQEEKQLLFDLSSEDNYNDPGSPIFRRRGKGFSVMLKLNGERKLLMAGAGASPEGNRPFLDVLDLDTRETKRIWQSQPPYLESMGMLLSDDKDDEIISLDGLTMLYSRENVQEPAQYYFHRYNAEKEDWSKTLFTDFPHPYPSLKDLNKEVVRYERKDGVQLTATLYTPPGYDVNKDGPLPCIMQVYPVEYKSKDAAGQLRRSPHQFVGIGKTSPILWLTQGYCVLDGPTMPIVAEGDEEPNDTYLEQLRLGAEAAIEFVKSRGVADENKIGIVGHSYGGVTVANLLANAPDLFACGISRSGSFNRTLTPFGFQSEQRSLWEAQDVYLKMSPLMMVNKIQKPLLLIHGEEDNNPGTLTMQSERFYQALKGNGVTTRLVLLPHEKHAYRAKESLLHCLYEMNEWLDKYCKGVVNNASN